MGNRGGRVASTVTDREDRIGALLSKDPNKTAEFTKGIDGHSLRANAFFPEELVERGIVITDNTDAEQINKIKDLAPDLRQNAKPISFLKQYGGGASKIQQVLKCSIARAKAISDNYDELYKVQIQFKEKNRTFAIQHGYVEGAFGLRLRTPKINRKAPDRNGTYTFTAEAEAESRSSSNMVTQSWGMLTNRAFIEFEQRMTRDHMHKDVMLINTIHDAIYMLIRNDAKVIKWVNDNLIECMEWQEDPMIHGDIKITADLDVGPSWDKQYTLAHNMSVAEISAFLKEHKCAS